MKDIVLQTAKAALIVLLAVMLAFLIRGSRRKIDFETVKENVLGAMDTSQMNAGDAQLLRRLYGLNSGEVKNWILYTSADNMAVEELLLVECASDTQTEQVEQAAAERADAQKNNFEGYGPEQVQLIEKSVLRVESPYVLFVISENAEQVKDAFVRGMYSFTG